MKKSFNQNLTGFFVTLFTICCPLAINNYAYAVNVTLTANTKQINNLIGSPDQYNEDYVVVAKNTTATFNLLGEYNGKPPISEEIKPGTPEWRFKKDVICLPNANGVIKPLPQPQTWTAGDTISTNVTAKSSITGNYSLKYFAELRFPKLKRDGTPYKDASGNPTYFGPYSTSVTVLLKVTDAKFKVWIESTDDNFPGHSLFKLGLKEEAAIKVVKIKSTDPNLVFSRSELGANLGAAITLSSQTVTATDKVGNATIKVWAKESSGKEYGPEELIVSVLKPNGIGMVRHKSYNKVAHTQGKAGVGIIGSPYLMPNNVSFCNLYAAEGSDSSNDGQVTVSGMYKLKYDSIKKECEPYWEIIENPASTPQERETAKRKLENIESKYGTIHCDSRNRFYYHKEVPGNFSIHKGIQNCSGKTNTFNTTGDEIVASDIAKNSYGVTTHTGFIDGTFNWKISQSYWTDEHDDRTKIQDFSSIDQIFIIDSNGTVTATKGNATGTALLNDPYSYYYY